MDYRFATPAPEACLSSADPPPVAKRARRAQSVRDRRDRWPAPRLWRTGAADWPPLRGPCRSWHWAGRRGRGDGLGQSPLSRSIFCRADDGRCAPDGECTAVARPDRLHDRRYRRTVAAVPCRLRDAGSRDRRGAAGAYLQDRDARRRAGAGYDGRRPRSASSGPSRRRRAARAGASCWKRA